MKNTNIKTRIRRRLKNRHYALLLLLFVNLFSYAQIASGVALNWNSYVGCQLFGEIRERDGKDPILLDDIIEGQCINVCRDTEVTYTLSGNLVPNPNTSWTVVGGTITYQSTTFCTVNWSGLGNATLTLTTTSVTGVVTKTICIEKIEIPKAIFTIAPFTDPEKDIYGCSLQTIYFTNLSSTNGGSGLYSYIWYFGDGEMSTAFAPTHIYAEDGDYEVTLIVTNSCGCSEKFSKKIKIGKRGFDITCPSVVCEGQTTSYSLPFEGRELCRDRYSWSVVGGHFVDQNDGSVDVTWDDVGASGFGTVSFDPSRCNLDCSLLTTIRVPVIQTNGTILGNSSTCLGSQERYVLPQWPATVFTWSVVGNTVDELLANVIHTDQRNEIIIQPRVSGDIILRCTYQNTLLHCGGTAEFVLHVINVMAINGPTVLCQNTTGNYNIPSGESSAWTLKNSSGTTISTSGSSNSFNYNFTVAGNYTLTITGSPSCPSNAVTISVLGTPPAAPSIGGSLIVCPTAPYTYTIPGSNPNGQYNWTVTGGTFIGPNTGNSVVVTFDSSATHVLTAVNQTQNPIQCNSLPISLLVTKQIIAADISAASSTICANTYADYQAIELGSSPEAPYAEGETYHWSLSDPNLGSVTFGQGSNSISILWNNVTSLTTVTLQLLIQKCTVTQTFTKTIVIKPVAQIAISTPGATVCSGSPITLTVVSTNGVVLDPLTQVSWNYGNGTVTNPITGLSITTYYNNTSLANIGFNATATIVNPNGCIGNAISPIKVITVLPAPSAAVSITSGGNAFCPPTPITTILTATVTSGATIEWHKQGTSTVYGILPTLSVTNSMGYGSYYIIATNANLCTTISNSVDIVQYCGSGGCTVSPQPIVTNDSELGCFAPTTATNCNCGIISLIGNASPTPSFAYWDIIGPNAANSYNNYIGTSIGTVSAPLIPGDYNIFYKAGYTCTNGQPGTLAAFQKVTVPYVANFSYAVECNGSNYNIALIDTSPYYAPVDNRTFTYYTSTSAAGPWTVVGSTPNYTITNQGPGNHYIRLVVTGDLFGEAQTPCEKIRLVTISGNTVQTITANPIPVKCYDTAVQFGLSGLSNSGDTYLWTFDSDPLNPLLLAQNTLPAPIRVFNTSGSQTVTLQITNKYGCLKPLLTYNLTVPDKCFNGTVSSTPNPASVCAGNSITLNYTPSGDNCSVSSYTWMNDDVSLGLTTPSIQVASDGFYWVKLSSAAPNSCTYETPNRITPLFKPIPTLETPVVPIYCYGVDVPLSISTNAPTITWVIDGYPFPVFDNQSSIVIPASWGLLGQTTHTVLVTVTSALGCSTSATFSVTIANSPPEPLIIPTVIGCDPYEVKLTATGSFGFYNWSDGQSGSDSIIVYNGGPYEVTVSAEGCTARSQIDVPKSPESYLWVFPSGCFTSCKNNLGTLIGPSILPVKEWEWQLDHNPVVEGSDAVPPFDLTQSGVYNLSLNTGLCAMTSNDLNYTLLDCPECPLEVRIEKLESTKSPFCTVTLDLIVFNSSGSNLPITLSSPNNNVIVSPSSFTAVPGVNLFHVSVTPINGFAGGTLELFIQGFDTKKNQLCTTPLLFEMPSCEQVARLEDPTVLNTNLLLIAPNPSKGWTTISYSHTVVPTIEVYSILGRKVANYSANTTKGSWELNTTGLPTGVYLVVLKDNDAVLMQKKLIVE